MSNETHSPDATAGARSKKRCSGGDCLAVTVYDDGSVDVYSTRRPRQSVVIDADEWAAFIEEAKAGLWDHTLRPDRLALLGHRAVVR